MKLTRQFRWVGLWPAMRLHDILVVDACIGGQFRMENVIRDLEKAYLSFVACKDDRISTGHWGCGAFGTLTPYRCRLWPAVRF